MNITSHYSPHLFKIRPIEHTERFSIAGSTLFYNSLYVHRYKIIINRLSISQKTASVNTQIFLFNTISHPPLKTSTTPNPPILIIVLCIMHSKFPICPRSVKIPFKLKTLIFIPAPAYLCKCLTRQENIEIYSTRRQSLSARVVSDKFSI